MRKYVLEDSYRVDSSLSPKGSQWKYKRGDYFYKLNKLGNEGFVEYIVSKIAPALGVSDYVKYEYCMINDRLGCRSKSFLGSGEQFISMEDIYRYVEGRVNLADKLWSFGNEGVRLRYLLWLVSEFGFNIDEFSSYLNRILEIDYITLNRDRHHRNYGLIVSDSGIRTAPLFDNGLALDTDRNGDFCSCTISGSFELQLSAFSYPYKSVLHTDKERLRAELKSVPYIQYYEYKFLLNRLRELCLL